MSFCPKCGAPVPDGSPYCNSCGAQINGLPMRWHKALVYVIMWLGMLVNLSNAIQYIFGLIYTAYGENYSREVYAAFPGLSFLDKGYGVACLAVVGFTLYAWFGLYGLKRGAWIYPTVLYAAGAGISVLYAIGLYVIEEDLVDKSGFSSVISLAVVSVGIAVANYTYYKKRSSLFVN